MRSNQRFFCVQELKAMNNTARDRDNERGSAGVKFTIALAVIFLVAHAAYNYIPVAYEAESVKSDMYTAVLQGMAMPGKVNIIENVRTRIQRTLTINNAPADAVMDIKQSGNSI